MSYYSLPHVKLYKKDEIRKLNNLTSNYSRLFYKDRTNDVDVDLPSTIFFIMLINIHSFITISNIYWFHFNSTMFNIIIFINYII